MENTVTMSLEKYDEMKRKIELQDDEIRFWGSCDNDGLVKVTCRGSYGNETYEFRDSDPAVKEINEKMQDERDTAKQAVIELCVKRNALEKERDQLKSEFNREKKQTTIMFFLCVFLFFSCLYFAFT